MKTEIFTTAGDGTQQECGHQTILFTEDMQGMENNVINLYPEARFEVFEGFGGAITDSAAYVYSLMNEEQKKTLIETYFSEEQMKYGIVRIHMDSCDFSTEMYEAMSDKEDLELKSFSFERTEKYILPMLEDAQKAAGKPLEIMLSPWSPPAFMKTNDSRKYGGSLKQEYYGMWADYLCRYIEEFQKRGYKVRRISLQNEPKAAQTWDSCIYTAAQEKEFLEAHMYPALKSRGMGDIEIFIWDHNKERVYERVKEIVDDMTKDMVAGVAFHWYSGDHFEALDLIRREYPDLKMIISESCIEYSKFGVTDERKNAARLSHEIIGDLNNGMTAFYDWNLLLDETGGPNHVGNFCHAPFLYDREKKILTPQLIFHHFNHFSHYIKKGARRIGFSRYTDLLDVTAFENPDGELVFVILNRTKQAIPVVLRVDGKIAELEVQPEAVCTGCISND
ncbi:glycoside hydrolase family 30 protein [Anaerobium acetethylicum]|uniref:Glucosylceramidase n=1 Tax=Anaerobium acetethylicum TaxID=1619234 RepID=A0A1D3TNF2_9FIRM|nr:glycoside hydrolase family 30 beta sandwich domain-containing protein [Anaerobium acetethylicum]SCP94850.1 glucosylceramidase [Anaerobium acetethylicum]